MPHEVEYEVRDQSDGKINLYIWVETRSEPIRHGIPVKQARQSSDDIETYIEKTVNRIAEQHHHETYDDTKLPSNGTVSVDPDDPPEKPSQKEERKSGSTTTDGS